MIRYLALVLVALALGVAAGVYLRSETGYVLVSYGPWILETSVLGLLATLAVLLLGLYLLLRVVSGVLRLPTTVREAVALRRERRAQQSFETGLRRLLEGRWPRAELELVRRAADHHAGELNYLLAARAAQRAGEPQRRDHYLELAARQGGEAAVTARLVRAGLMLERGEAAGALPLLEELHQADRQHPYVIELLAEAYAHTQAWDPLRRLLAGGEAARALAPERYRELYARALQEELARASESARLDVLKALWAATPTSFRARPALRARYLRGLARVGADAEAAAQIVQMLGAGWDGALVEIYGQLTGIDPMSQLATVEQWLNQHGEKPELLVAAARACMRNQIWGKARSYLDAALRLRPSPAVYLALAQLCEQTKNPEEAGLFHRRGLELAAAAADVAAAPSVQRHNW